MVEKRECRAELRQDRLLHRRFFRYDGRAGPPEYDSRVRGGRHRLPRARLHFSFRRQRQQQHDHPQRYGGLPELLNDPANLALAQNTLLPIVAKTGNVPYGLHPQLPGLQGLFNSGQLAVLANVGTLAQPTTQAQYQQGGATLPVNLFSHSDQQAQMQTANFAGFSPSGWAGRTADKLQSMNAGAQYPPITSVAGGAIMCVGDQTVPFTLSPGASPGLTGYTAPRRRMRACFRSSNCSPLIRGFRWCRTRAR